MVLGVWELNFKTKLDDSDLYESDKHSSGGCATVLDDPPIPLRQLPESTR